MTELVRSWAFWAVIGLVVLMFAIPAKASPVAASGVFCDTKEQVGHFLDAVGAGMPPPRAVEVVNSIAPNACVLGQAVVIGIEEVEKKGEFTIVKLTVVAVLIPQPMPVAPMVQFFAIQGVVKPAVDA